MVYQDVDLVEVTDGVIEIFSMVASLNKIRIREMKPERMMVNADIDMLKTVVRNLLSNAIKFSKENSEILVKMEEVNGMAVVSVQDHGCGISEEGQKQKKKKKKKQKVWRYSVVYFQGGRWLHIQLLYSGEVMITKKIERMVR